MQDENIEKETRNPSPHRSGWLAAAAIVLACATGLSFFELYHERQGESGLVQNNAALKTTLDQTRTQLDALTAKMNTMQSPPAQPVSKVAPSTPQARHRAVRRRAEDPRFKKIQDELAQHQKQIESTQQDIQNARNELEGNLNSTRDELNGSIAKTHDALVELQKRGERNYFEFDLSKSKSFQRVGPVSLSLRKTNVKNEYFDVAVLVDDVRLNKKHVNLFEPVLFYPSGSRQPLELVVNEINKNRIHGYVSQPKYGEAQASQSGAGANGAGASTAQTNLSRRPGIPN